MAQATAQRGERGVTSTASARGAAVAARPPRCVPVMRSATPHAGFLLLTPAYYVNACSRMVTAN